MTPTTPTTPGAGRPGRQTVEEFRANRGPLGDIRALLLTTADAASGARVTHLVPFLHGEGPGSLLVIAVPSGAQGHPAWYENLRADPRVSVETGVFDIEARAEVLPDEERDRVLTRAAQADADLAAARSRYGGALPVVALVSVAGRPAGRDAWGDGLKVVHGAFRRELNLIRAEVRAAGPSLGAQLRINCLTVCAGLRHHSGMEEAQMFPTLDQRHPELAETVALLREEHAAIEALLEELRALVGGEDAGHGAVVAKVDELTARVEAHLDHEEERLVPILNALMP